MDLKYQRRLAAQLLKCGINRVYIDPEAIEDVSMAATKKDIRERIKANMIQVKPKKGVSRGRAKLRWLQRRKGRQRGVGSRKGTANARTNKKRMWIKTIRAVRKLLRTLRDNKKIDRKTYRKYYRLSKAGNFKSRAHLMLHLKSSNLLKGGGD